eukprot:TRINITY_DN9678_c0_g1_i3.p1 TRINITY_DN9678_c0_g1~~TRINITY_DN9678_c0_g1_i3.p1  ORF type:complete len:489 (+),score=72.73 TRINITY_DN9678_c0_g1_i3:28-1494(+)
MSEGLENVPLKRPRTEEPDFEQEGSDSNHCDDPKPEERLDLVEHIQNEEMGFNLEALPDVPLKKIFLNLDCKELKNIRMVSRRLAEIVLQLRPEMRAWKVNLKSQFQEKVLFLDNLREKGIPLLKHFRLNLDAVCTEESLGVLRAWKDHVFGLRIDLLLQSTFALHLPNLVVLTISQEEFDLEDTFTGNLVKDIINQHSATLKSLRLLPTNLLDDQVKQINELPHLHSLAIDDDPSLEYLRSMFCYQARNLTVLSLGEGVHVYSIDHEHLKLPNLKQLRIESSYNLELLHANADHLEVLSVLAADQSWDEISWGDFPETLPRLQTLSCNYDNNDNIEIPIQLLLASAKSLRHLVLKCVGDRRNFEHMCYAPITMECLTHFMFDNFPGLSTNLTTSCANTLEFITVGMDRRYDEILRERTLLPRLKEMVWTYIDRDFMTGMRYFEEMRQDYQHADFRTQKTDSYWSFAQENMKKFGAHELVIFKCKNLQ